MIQSLRIQNFQSHRDTLLEFDPGVNIIFGTSLNGKTAIARALQLAAYNRPLGIKYYSNFAPDKGSTIINLKLNDAPNITVEKKASRKKDGTKELISTTYSFDKEETSNLSDTIKNALNISELNIQKQFDAPFLILSSAGEFARVINRVTRLEKVDEWVAEFKRRINKGKNEVSLLEEQAKSDEIELKKYVGFEDLEVEVKKLQDISTQLEKSELTFNRLDSLLEKMELIDDEIDRLKPALEIEKDILVLIGLDSSIVSLVNLVSSIERLKAIDSIGRDLQLLITDLNELIGIMELEEQQNELATFLVKIKGMEGNMQLGQNLIDDLGQLIGMMEQEEVFNKLDGYLFKIESINNYTDSENAIYNKVELEVKEILKNVAECPIFLKKCPVVKEMNK